MAPCRPSSAATGPLGRVGLGGHVGNPEEDPLAQTRPGNPSPRAKVSCRECRSKAGISTPGACQTSTHRSTPALASTDPDRSDIPVQALAEGLNELRGGSDERLRHRQDVADRMLGDQPPLGLPAADNQVGDPLPGLRQSPDQVPQGPSSASASSQSCSASRTTCSGRTIFHTPAGRSVPSAPGRLVLDPPGVCSNCFGP